MRGGRFQLTDSHGLDTDTLLKVSIGSIIGVLALQNLLAAESVDECCAACGKETRLVPGSPVIRFETYLFHWRRTPSNRIGFPS